MSIQKINFGAGDYDDYQVNNQNKKNVVILEQEPVDEEKSKAAKFMIGASALAGIAALGIAGYKGKLGKNIQKLFTQSEKAAEKKVSETAGTVQNTTKHSSSSNIPAKNVDNIPKTPEIKPETPEVSTPQTPEPSESKIPETTTDVLDVNSSELPVSKDDIPEALRGIEGKREGNRIIQDLENGKQKIYEFVPGKNTYSVTEKSINLGYETTYYREDGLVDKVYSWHPDAGSFSRTFSYDELKRKTSVKGKWNRIENTTDFIYEGKTTRLKQKKTTKIDEKFSELSGVSVIDYRNGKPIKETQFALDGKTVNYYQTFQPAPYDGVSVPKRYVEFHKGSKNKYIETERDPFGKVILHRKYAKDGKTLTYEEVIKDGRKTIKGRLSNEYDLNH